LDAEHVSLYASSSECLVGIRKVDRYRDTLTLLDLPDDAEDGAAAVGRYLDAFRAGELDPRDIHARLDNEDLAAVPEVARQMRLRGITP
jgi:hypothetical protein